MTPKEKAEELVKKYEIQFLSFGDYLPTIKAKQCALIAVNEIIKADPTSPLINGYFELYSDMLDEAIQNWQQVKKEIEKL